MKDVRCVVCQAQSIDESDAGIASDMRRLIRAEIADGKTDEEIRTYLADRYGDFVLFKPPFKATTALLWVGPFLLLAFGAGIIVVFFRKRRTGTSPQTQLNADEARRVADALRGAPEDGTRSDNESTI
jgi:cytochrome c-type biogenesis protein CcmH